VERANTLRCEAAATNSKSLLNMQTAMNTKQTAIDNKLSMMDKTIRTVHEGQKLNDDNIQLLMKQFKVFGEQMKLLQTHHSVTPAYTPEMPTKAKETPTKALTAVPTGHSNSSEITIPPGVTPATPQAIPPKDVIMEDELIMDTDELDTIMSDTESKKRMVEQAVIAEATKKKKDQNHLSTRRRSGRGQ